MAGKPPRQRSSTTATIPGQRSSVADRVRWLLKNMWDDNRSAMAADVGCTHSVLAKIATGKQNPGRRLLTAIAEVHKVSPAWLWTGVGEPLVAKAGSGVAEGLVLPVSTEPLGGDLERHRDHLSERSFPVQAAFFRPSRYWLEVAKGAPVVRASENIASGDLLLIETDQHWCRQEASVRGHLCVVHHETRGLELARVERIHEAEEDIEYLQADPFLETGYTGPSTQQLIIELPAQGKPTLRTAYLRPESGGSKLRRYNPSMVRPDVYPVNLSAVVGVCLHMWRPRP